MVFLKKLYSGEALNDADATQVVLVFFCPGCQTHHSYRIKGPQPVWQWNGDMEKPTFSPSLLVHHDLPTHRCHLFLRGGMLEYCSDSYHELKGKTVPLPECQW